jgi:two-component system, cell cycle response regulator
MVVNSALRSRKSKGPMNVSTATAQGVERLSHLLAWTIRFAIQQQKETDKMRRLALTDELTGLYNRRGFLLLAKQQLKLARRAGRNILVVFVDVNGLKRFNDTFGHSEGDCVLEATATVLRGSVRDSDIVARVGGDEFVILAHEVAEGSERSIASRLTTRLRAHNERMKGRCPLSLSYGFSAFSCRYSIEDLMTQADRDMYRRKQACQSSPIASRSGKRDRHSAALV